MDLMIRNYIKRSENEILAAQILFRLSHDEDCRNYMEIDERATFYSSVISHSYYSIFYAANAILLTRNIRTSYPDVHKKTLEEFSKNFVETGVLDAALLEIYRKMAVRADELLRIFSEERWKRGNFTYSTIPQANREPAQESINNAKFFVSNIIKAIETIR